MPKKIIAASLVAIAACFAASMALAEFPKALNAKHADKNKDGVVGKKEARMAGKPAAKPDKDKLAKVNNPWEKKADKDKDGVVEKGEAAKYMRHIDKDKAGKAAPGEKRHAWQYGQAKVNTPLEQKYDRNKDGILDPVEYKEMLKDRHALIASEGKARVDSEIEKEYDANKDGIIDVKEAEAMKRDIVIP